MALPHMLLPQVNGPPIQDISGGRHLVGGATASAATSAASTSSGTVTSATSSSFPPEAADALDQARREHQATRGALARAAMLESDTEADTEAEPAGAGVKGLGTPMRVGSHESQRDLCDGAGLCSLGVWPPWQRPELRCPLLRRVRSLILDYMQHMEANTGYSVQALFDALAEGRVTTSPFEDKDSGFRSLVDAVLHTLSQDGDRAYARTDDVPQVIRIRLLQRVLQLGGDPDYRGMEHFAKGVRIGVGTKMPRTPAVYSRKRRWRLPGQADLDFDIEGERESLGDEWRDNYQSAVIHQKDILAQLVDASERNMALRLTPDEADYYFPNLTINSLGGVAKITESGEVASVRVVLDGTHGVVVNRAIRQRDQDRCPVAADVKRVQREQARTRPALGLALDVREAHRLPRVHEDDWAHQGCRSDASPDVFVFLVGCFGISSAAYWWSRLGGALIRAIHLLSEPSDELWMLLMADDLKAESTSASPATSVIYALLILLVMGVPLSWHKSQGGRTIRWIGYEVQLSTLSLGITQARAQWCIDFLNQISRDARVDVGRMRSGLGRLCFVVGALEWERPFLAPFFLFLARQPKSGLRSAPLFIRVLASYLVSRLQLRRAYPSAVERVRGLEPFRVDASAVGDKIGVGGWWPVRGESGQLETKRSPWFSFELNEGIAPWAYSRGQPFRAIAALEAVAVLAALVVFEPLLQRNADVTYAIPALTDNRGNQSTITRLQSSKFPLNAVLMEVAARSEARRVRLSVSWIPREFNAEADQLAGGNFSLFDPQHRLEVNWERVHWLVLDQLLALGAEFHAETRQSRAALAQQKPRKQAPLRETDPW